MRRFIETYQINRDQIVTFHFITDGEGDKEVNRTEAKLISFNKDADTVKNLRYDQLRDIYKNFRNTDSDSRKGFYYAMIRLKPEVVEE